MQNAMTLFTNVVEGDFSEVHIEDAAQSTSLANMCPL
jgi:hypothetical protein